MQRSNSNSHFDDSEIFSSLSGSGADLSRYQEQLARERNSRTLNLRHVNRISITSVIQNPNHLSGSKGYLNSNNYPFLDSSKFIDAINSNNLPLVTQYTQGVATTSATSSRMLNSLLTNDFIGCVIDKFSNPGSDEMLIQLINLLSVVFPLCGAMRSEIIEGIIFSFFGLFESTSPEIIMSTIRIISVMSSSFVEARDSFLSFEFYKNLIQIALRGISVELTRAACSALYSIFSNNNDAIDSERLISIVPDLIKLFGLTDKVSIANVIECLVEMTNMYNQLVFNLFDEGIYQLSVQMLKDEELVGPTLHLVGNLSVAEPREVKVLIECGVLPILYELLKTEYVADSFWVLSNLLEKTTNDIIPFCTPDFIKRVIDIIQTSSFEVQKEGSFFLATFILYSPVSTLPSFMNQTIIDILVQMINCGTKFFILRCIDTIIKILNYAQSNLQASSDFFSQLMDSDLRDNLQELVESENGLNADKASFLLGMIENIENDLGS